jgi:rhodanese-related sulfurtransferase
LEHRSDVQAPIEICVHTVKAQLDLEQVVLIDCREQIEWDYARIDGARLVPLSQWPGNVDQLAELAGGQIFAGRQIVVYCHHGVRSLQATRWLRLNGFPDAQSMSGGIDRWSIEVDSVVPRY